MSMKMVVHYGNILGVPGDDAGNLCIKTAIRGVS